MNFFESFFSLGSASEGRCGSLYHNDASSCYNATKNQFITYRQQENFPKCWEKYRKRDNCSGGLSALLRVG